MEKHDDELKKLKDVFLANLGIHNQFQLERDQEQARLVREAMHSRYPPASLRVRESSSGYSVPAYAFRELNAEELAERERPRSRTLGPAAEIKPVTPSLRFTAGEIRGALQSLDILIVEAVEKGTSSIYQIEARRAEDVFNCAWSLTHDSMGAPNGNTARCYADTGLKSGKDRVFCELLGQVEDDPGALVLGDLKVFSDDVLPVNLPSNTETVAYAQEQLRKERKAWAAKHAPDSPEDKKRAREEASKQAEIAAGIKAGLDAFGKPRNEPSNPQQVAL